MGEKNVLNKPLVNSRKVLLPSLHIKLWQTKQFLKSLDQYGDCFKYLSRQLLALSCERNLKPLHLTSHRLYSYCGTINFL